MSFRKTAAALMLSLLFLCLLFSASAQDAAHTAVPRNGLIFVNGQAHAGTPFLQDENGSWYFPMEEISAALGLDAPQYEDGFIDWCGFWMDSQSGDFASHDGRLYAVVDLLKDAGVHVNESESFGQDILVLDSFPRLDYSWAENTHLIAHAMGAIDGYDYTNSLEAFQFNYAKGFTVFEVDLQMSADGDPVAIHDWEHLYSIANLSADNSLSTKSFPPLSASAFKSLKLHGQYTPLTFEDIAHLMADHPDIYLVTDTKDAHDPEATQIFTALRNIAQSVDPEILDRIIPQIYNREMFGLIMSVYPWKSVIFTMYKLPFSDWIDAIIWGYQNGIQVFTSPQHQSNLYIFNLIDAIGGKAFTHTVNDWEAFRYNRQHGIHGIYTDSLNPLMMDGVEDWKDEPLPVPSP